MRPLTREALTVERQMPDASTPEYLSRSVLPAPAASNARAAFAPMVSVALASATGPVKPAMPEGPASPSVLALNRVPRVRWDFRAHRAVRVPTPALKRVNVRLAGVAKPHPACRKCRS
jgi:hypothetical protein